MSSVSLTKILGCKFCCVIMLTAVLLTPYSLQHFGLAIAFGEIAIFASASASSIRWKVIIILCAVATSLRV
jgi:succinate dehydrogenase hydrophobic anchor subunit